MKLRYALFASDSWALQSQAYYLAWKGKISVRVSQRIESTYTHTWKPFRFPLSLCSLSLEPFLLLILFLELEYRICFFLHEKEGGLIDKEIYRSVSSNLSAATGLSKCLVTWNFLK